MGAYWGLDKKAFMQTLAWHADSLHRLQVEMTKAEDVDRQIHPSRESHGKIRSEHAAQSSGRVLRRKLAELSCQTSVEKALAVE